MTERGRAHRGLNNAEARQQIPTAEEMPPGDFARDRGMSLVATAKGIGDSHQKITAAHQIVKEDDRTMRNQETDQHRQPIFQWSASPSDKDATTHPVSANGETRIQEIGVTTFAEIEGDLTAVATTDSVAHRAGAILTNKPTTWIATDLLREADFPDMMTVASDISIVLCNGVGPEDSAAEIAVHRQMCGGTINSRR